MDNIRNQDLLPRFPQGGGQNGQNSGPNGKSQIYTGEEISPIEGTQTQLQPTSNGQGYELNFENAPIGSVAKTVLGDILKIGYTIDPRVQGTISLTSGRAVPKSDLLFVFENALRLTGVAMVRDAMGYRLIPISDAVAAGNLDSTAARAEPGYGISVVPLQYVSASTLIRLLDSFATKPGTVRVDTSRNILLIQGTGPERRAAIETALSFDVDWMRGQSVGIFPVQNSNPEPVIAELEKILDSKEGGFSQDIVKFQVIARRNAILAVTSKPAMLRTVEQWIKRLDAADTTRNGVHVYRVKYGEARQLARVLSDVFGGGSTGSLDTPASQVAPGSGLSKDLFERRSSARPVAATGIAIDRRRWFQWLAAHGWRRLAFRWRDKYFGRRTAASAGGGVASTFDARSSASGGGGGQPALEGVKISADVSTNSLLVYASAENYRIVEQTIRQLDQPQAQVGIDATIAEVTLNNNSELWRSVFYSEQKSRREPDRGSAPQHPDVATECVADGSSMASQTRFSIVHFRASIS